MTNNPVIFHPSNENKMKKGQIVKSVTGEVLTVMSINGNMVRVYEDSINMYHIEKLIF